MSTVCSTLGCGGTSFWPAFNTCANCSHKYCSRCSSNNAHMIGDIQCGYFFCGECKKDPNIQQILIRHANYSNGGKPLEFVGSFTMN